MATPCNPFSNCSQISCASWDSRWSATCTAFGSRRMPPAGQSSNPVLLCRHASFFPRASERRVLPIVGVCISPSHLHTFSSSHLLIFTSAHLHIFSHICSSSHLLIFTSSLTSAHLHICSSSYLLSHLLSHLLSSAHLSSYLLLSHLLIFTSAHLHICSSSHLL